MRKKLTIEQLKEKYEKAKEELEEFQPKIATLEANKNKWFFKYHMANALQYYEEQYRLRCDKLSIAQEHEASEIYDVKKLLEEIIAALRKEKKPDLEKTLSLPYQHVEMYCDKHMPEFCEFMIL